MKVLFLTPHFHLAASNRYRVYQYLPYLQKEGIEPLVRPFVDTSEFYRILYEPGHHAKKITYTLRGTLRRILDILHSPNYDAVFILREALPFGPAWLERALARTNKPVIFDFDDAVYLPHISEANRWLEWLKNPEKTAEIIRIATHVTVGNEHLYRYAIRFNDQVTVIPTSIDTDRYTVRAEPPSQNEPVTIGWIGSHTTAPYLGLLDRALGILSQRFAIRVLVIGGEHAIEGVQVTCRPWNLDDEVKELHCFDIGFAPMPDDEWTRAKSGLKALLYMSVGIPAVASPVGINTKIIQHGENGFLASTTEEWVKYLAMLIENRGLRNRLGSAGRKTVEMQYAIAVNAPKLAAILRACASPESW